MSNQLETLTKEDLVRCIGEFCPDSKLAAKIANTLVEVLTNAILSGQNILIANVGTIVSYKKSERMGRNPQTGVERVIPERTVVTLRRSASVENRLTKKQIAQQIKLEVPEVSYNVIMQCVGCFIEGVQSVKLGQRRIELRGFGVFYPSFLSARTVRNPQTGETSKLDERVAIRFRCSKKILAVLNESH